MRKRKRLEETNYRFYFEVFLFEKETNVYAHARRSYFSSVSISDMQTLAMNKSSKNRESKNENKKREIKKEKNDEKMI